MFLFIFSPQNPHPMKRIVLQREGRVHRAGNCAGRLRLAAFEARGWTPQIVSYA
jgi:hypothetical protein